MKTVEIHKGVKAIPASSAKVWRRWLAMNCERENSVWLIIYKKESGFPSVNYPEAVDEALCYGWVDSKINKRDEISYYQYFAKRNPKSNWSKINKEKVERLLEKGRMAPPGLAMIDLAKKMGTWTALDPVEALAIPDDMMKLFRQNKTAFTNWEKFPRSAKRGILEWILNAKQAETRQKRIAETVEKAGKNLKVLFDK
jgi:uncharacterized protein YdeI (YjbR/CyaY-like superfamily)